MTRLGIVIVALSLCSAPALAKDRSGPAVSPAAVKGAFSQIGLVEGAERPLDGGRIRIERLRVSSSGKWIVVRILPKRAD
jgi:hypothetical protein